MVHAYTWQAIIRKRPLRGIGIKITVVTRDVLSMRGANDDLLDKTRFPISLFRPTLGVQCAAVGSTCPRLDIQLNISTSSCERRKVECYEYTTENLFRKQKFSKLYYQTRTDTQCLRNKVLKI